MIAIADAVSKPEDHVRLIMCLVLQTPIGFILNTFVTSPGLPRYLYSMVVGFFIQLYMFRETTYHIYLYALGCWVLMHVLPRNTQHKVMVAFLLTYMSSQHIYSMITDFGGFHMDVTTYTMILVCKLWMFSFAYKDGGEDHKTLTKDQMERKIDEMPSIIEYLSYVFYCGGGIVGPVFEFADFKNFMELKGHYKDMPRGTSSYVTIVPAMKELLGGFVCIGVHVALVVAGGFDIYFCGSKEYLTYGTWFTRVGYYHVAMTS